MIASLSQVKNKLWRLSVKIVAFLARLPFFVFVLLLFKQLGLMELRHGIGGATGFILNFLLFFVAWMSATAVAYPLLQRGQLALFYGLALALVFVDIFIIWAICH